MFLMFQFFYAAACDCPDFAERYSEAIAKLKSMIDIKPRVIEDSTNIRDKFPCNFEGLHFLERFVSDFYLLIFKIYRMHDF